MNSGRSGVQPAVKQETRRVAVCTAAGVCLMWALFAALHVMQPEVIPFDWTVFAGGAAGGAVAVLNFFLMGLTIQKAAAMDREEDARLAIRSSYSRRMLLQMLWVIAAIAAPCFQFAAGIAPLLFPGIGIKLMGILRKDQ